MGVFLRLEQETGTFEHYADVYVERYVFLAETVVVGVLDVTALVLLV